MSTLVEQAADFYNKACLAEEKSEMTLAEVYYLKSRGLFEQAGGAHFIDAANALSALAFLRERRGNYDGALCSAKQCIKIMETYKTQFADHDADLIQRQAWELINRLIGYEIPLQRLVPTAG